MLAWWIGLVLIVAAVTHVAVRMACTDCEPNGRFLEWIVLAIIPVTYAVVMFIAHRWHKARVGKRGEIQ